MNGLSSATKLILILNRKSYVKHKHLIKNIFNHLWLTDYYGEAENSLIKIIMSSGKFRWYESSLFVSAITLSALRTFQTEKLLYLVDFYEAGQEQVMERALSGLILNLHYYNGRILLYPEITSRINKSGQRSRVQGILQDYRTPDYPIA